MTGADADIMNADGPRAELMLHLRDEQDAFADVWRQLAVLAAAPAVEGVVYRAGMTVDLGQPLAAGSACTGALSSSSRRSHAIEGGRGAATRPGDAERARLVPGARQRRAARALERPRRSTCSISAARAVDLG